MPRKATVIDCGERCRKLEHECIDSGRSASDCRRQREQCRAACAYQ